MFSIFYVFALLVCALVAQAENLTKEQQRILLDLEEAHLMLEQTKAREAEVEIEYEQMIGLKERGVITGQELRIARERFERARQERQRADLSLQRAFLHSLADATHLTVVNGQKYGVEGDKVRVRLTLRNDSDLHLAQMVDQARRRYEINGLDQDAASLLQVNNIFATILADHVMVGQPYQVHIPVLALGEEVEIEVGLQRPEVEDLTVQLEYLNRTDDHVIHLEKASARDVVRVYATQFSQEGPLGNSVAYELQLERLAEDEKIFQLMAHGLPADFRYEFASGGRNLSRLRFSRDHSSDSLTLNVYVPEQAEDFAVDQPLLFSVLAYEPKTVEAEVLAAADPERLQAMGIGYEQLQLVPTGRAELELTTLNLDLSVNGEGQSKSVWHLRNLGTVALLDIRLQALSPPGWHVSFEPPEIAHIAPREELEATLTVQPIDSAEIGRYEVKTSASTQHKGQWVESVERTVNINIKSDGSFWGITGLVVLLVSIVLGIAVFTVQWSKR
jgi:hypothetical protein